MQDYFKMSWVVYYKIILQICFKDCFICKIPMDSSGTEKGPDLSFPDDASAV